MESKVRGLCVTLTAEVKGLIMDLKIPHHVSLHLLKLPDIRVFNIRIYRKPLTAVCGLTFKHNSI